MLGHRKEIAEVSAKSRMPSMSWWSEFAESRAQGQQEPRRRLMRKKVIGLTLSATLFALSVNIEAQQPKKVHRIGFLSATGPADLSARTEAFRQELRELGYVEGKNIVIEYWWAGGKLDRLPELVADLVRIKVDLIVTAGDASLPPAKEATSSIAIVMAVSGDPVGAGVVVSLARPGGNITGLASLEPEISGKQRSF
jgi:putative tryptophan/tyrosine transport system substrate-binding protein